MLGEVRPVIGSNQVLHLSQHLLQPLQQAFPLLLRHERRSHLRLHLLADWLPGWCREQRGWKLPAAAALAEAGSQGAGPAAAATCSRMPQRRNSHSRCSLQQRSLIGIAFCTQASMLMNAMPLYSSRQATGSKASSGSKRERDRQRRQRQHLLHHAAGSLISKHHEHAIRALYYFGCK